MHTVSSDVIISISVLAGTVVVMALLIVTSLGSIKLYKKILSNKKQKTCALYNTINVCTDDKCYRLDDKTESSFRLDANLKVMIRGSLKAKCQPVPALTINSTNLRVLDPIGQGMGAA